MILQRSYADAARQTLKPFSAASSAASRSALLACGKRASGFSVAGLITSSPLRPSPLSHLPSMKSSRLAYMTSSLGLLLVWFLANGLAAFAGAREGAGLSLGARRIDDEIGEAAVPIVHSGK